MSAPGSRPPELRLAWGCVAGLALGAAGTWLRFALERTLRIDTHTLAFVLASAASGLGLLLAGVCALRLAPRAGRISWGALLGAGLAAQGVAFLSLPLTSSDVFQYLCYGEMLRAGVSPYLAPPAVLGSSPLLVPAQWIHAFPSPYGPLLHLVARGAAAAGARLGAPLWGGLWAFKAAMLAAVLAALAVAARHLRAARPREGREILAVLALGPLLAWELPGQGHNDALPFLAVTVFLVAAARERRHLAAAALALGAAVKLTVLPLLGLYLLLEFRRSFRRALSPSAASLVLLGACYASDLNGALRGIFLTVGGAQPRHAHSLVDLGCLALEALGHPGASLAWCRALSIASCAACLTVLAWTAWRSRTLSQLARGYLLFLLVLYLTTPWFQPWYVTWALPFLLVEPDPDWRRFLALFSVVTVVQWAAPLDPVTTVAGDLWAAHRLWRLLRPRALDAEGEPGAGMAA